MVGHGTKDHESIAIATIMTTTTHITTTTLFLATQRFQSASISAVLGSEISPSINCKVHIVMMAMTTRMTMTMSSLTTMANLDNPESADIKHGVSVILVLGPTVKELVVPPC